MIALHEHAESSRACANTRVLEHVHAICALQATDMGVEQCSDAQSSRRHWHCKQRTVWHVRVTEVLASFAVSCCEARPRQCVSVRFYRGFSGVLGLFGGPSLSAGVREAPEGKLLRGSES